MGSMAMELELVMKRVEPVLEGVLKCSIEDRLHGSNWFFLEITI